MPLEFVTGDPLLTTCDTLAIGYNAKGRTELDALTMRAMREFPVPFSVYLRRCRQEKQKGGDVFFWAETKPKLLILSVRDSGVGATRLRHVQKCLIELSRDYAVMGIKSLAIAPIGNKLEASEIKPLYEQWFASCKLPVVVYEASNG
jgi:hypothetical protein